MMAESQDMEPLYEFNKNSNPSLVRQYRNKKLSNLNKLNTSFKSYAKVNRGSVFNVSANTICNEAVDEQPHHEQNDSFLNQRLVNYGCGVDHLKKTTSLEIQKSLNLENMNNSFSSPDICGSYLELKDDIKGTVEYFMLPDLPCTLSDDENIEDYVLVYNNEGTCSKENQRCGEFSVCPKVNYFESMKKEETNDENVKRNCLTTLNSTEHNESILNVDQFGNCDQNKDISLNTNKSTEEKVNGESGILKCPRCDLVFLSSILCRQHLRSHFEKLQCDLCNKIFKSVAPFLKHMNLNDCHNRKFRCRFKGCKLSFSLKNKRKEHYKQFHVKIKRFVCEQCSEVFQNRSALKSHLLDHVGGKPYQCSVCKERFKSPCILDTHLRKIHTTEYPKYVCSMCKKSFNNKQPLITHIRAHTEENMFICSVCGKCLKSRGSFRYHFRTHNTEKSWQCSQCHKTFKFERILKSHMSVHTQEKPFKCSHCGRCFSFSGNLSRHLHLHSAEKQFQCEECGKKFFQKQNLVCHVQRNHMDFKKTSQYRKRYVQKVKSSITGQVNQHKRESNMKQHNYYNKCTKKYLRQFQCHLCGKLFQSNQSLSFHFNTHGKLRPFKCHVCKRGFATPSNLLRHSFIHKSKQFLCNVCGKKFSQHQTLVIHLHTHSKPYLCAICKRNFSDRRSLKRHMRLHGEERLFECAECRKCFYHKISLKNHIEIFHLHMILRLTEQGNLSTDGM